jgi:hypothetical protein
MSDIEVPFASTNSATIKFQAQDLVSYHPHSGWLDEGSPRGTLSWCGTVHVGTAEPFRVAPPQAVAYLKQLKGAFFRMQLVLTIPPDKAPALEQGKPKPIQLALSFASRLHFPLLRPAPFNWASCRCACSIVDEITKPVICHRHQTIDCFKKNC